MLKKFLLVFLQKQISEDMFILLPIFDQIQQDNQDA